MYMFVDQISPRVQQTVQLICGIGRHSFMVSSLGFHPLWGKFSAFSAVIANHYNAIGFFLFVCLFVLTKGAFSGDVSPY